MSGDFENATDNLEHEVVLHIMLTFLDGMECRSTYLESALRLLLSPRDVYDSRRDDGPSWTTVRGVLMGEPLTKVCLTVISYVASIASQLGIQPN